MQPSSRPDPVSQSVSLPQAGRLLYAEALDYANPYDFRHLHRHDYFELILVAGGSGSQLIDFGAFEMSGAQIYAIYPGQLHLMQRASATGLLLQFRKDLFEYLQPVKHHHLYLPTPVCRFDDAAFSHLYDLAQRIHQLMGQPQPGGIDTHKAYSYLQIILLSIIGQHQDGLRHPAALGTASRFLSLLTQHVHARKKVGEYCQLIGCSADKLNEACRRSFGKTALELIHEEVLLEIRRLLLLNERSLKEIAYALNFENQPNFSAFIRSRTGLSPSELHREVLRIYNY